MCTHPAAFKFDNGLVVNVSMTDLTMRAENGNTKTYTSKGRLPRKLTKAQRQGILTTIRHGWSLTEPGIERKCEGVIHGRDLMLYVRTTTSRQPETMTQAERDTFDAKAAATHLTGGPV